MEAESDGQRQTDGGERQAGGERDRAMEGEGGQPIDEDDAWRVFRQSRETKSQLALVHD